jgi:hypothetical protein
MSDPNADIIKGYRFSATLQLRTPLRVLQHHGELQPWSENGLPAYARSLWEGIWLPVTKTWAELAGSGAKIKNPSASDEQALDDAFRRRLVDRGWNPEKAATVIREAMASDIGPIPQDGGTYLGFLKAFRGIVEFAASPDEKREAIEALSKDHPDYARYISVHLARSNNWPDEWLGYQEWLQIRGIGTRIARCLYDAGFRSREALKQASDTELSAVKGVGKATVLQIRRALS